MPRLNRASMHFYITAILLFVAATASALPGDPPLYGGDCDPEKRISTDDPDLPVTIAVVYKMIEEEALKMLKVKIAPYIEIDPETGKEFYRGMYQPQVDAATREVEEWQRRAKDKAEKYVEVNPCSKKLVIRMKYLDLIF